MSDKQLIEEAEDFLRRAPYLNYGTARKLVGALKDRQWISVKDRLPEKNGDYLIYNTDGIVWPYWYDKEYKEWYDSSGYLTESVTHWMPLPAAPEE